MKSSSKHAPTHAFALIFALALLSVTLACANPRKLGSGVRHSSGQAGVTVLGFGFSVLSMEREQAFLRTLGMVVRNEHGVAGPALEHLLGVHSLRGREARLVLGDEQLVLTQLERPGGRSVTVRSANDVGFQHIAIVVRDLDEAYAWLRKGVVQTVSTAPQTLPASNPAAAGVRAVYVRDPEGHFLELIQFPPGKGETKWQRTTNALFMGIDHSAIVSTDTQASLVFYRDLLGMRVVSQSLNVGLEQEQLSRVEGARVRVTSLRGSAGPGVELLEYLSPRTGEPFPELGAADSAYWEITLEVQAIDALLGALRGSGFSAPASCVELGRSASASVCAALIHDPDGHALRLVQRGVRASQGQP